jgi:hypothetical protein
LCRCTEDGRSTLKRALRRMTRVALAAAFHRWSERTSVNRQHRTRVMRAVTRMHSRVVSSVFLAWRDVKRSHKVGLYTLNAVDP